VREQLAVGWRDDAAQRHALQVAAAVAQHGAQLGGGVNNLALVGTDHHQGAGGNLGLGRWGGGVQCELGGCGAGATQG
jgi:hypothetical protein